VQRFVQEGAKVVAFDLSEARLEALKQEIDGVAVVQGDVRRIEDNRKAVATAVSEFGGLSVFVGNAGIHDGRRKLESLSDEELENGYDEVLGINLKGYLLGAKAALPELKKTGGRMVFTLSTSSFYVGGGVLYVASKHAALGMVRQLANELAPHIRVNGVAPSGTVTGLRTASSLAGKNPTNGVFGVGRKPANNILELTIAPEDHAAAYVLLASSQSKTMTGAVINTDAGRGVTSFRSG
jgi:NAD(P)-dependent dehydrogenase (short-subunit alcohol dehydrogenase family)